MRNRSDSIRLVTLVTLVAIGGVVACGERSSEGPPVVLAAASPSAVEVERVPAVETSTESVSTPAAPIAVSYDDAQAVFRSGQYAESVTLFERYVATRPENAHGHYMLGLSSWRAGDAETAERALVRAVELDGSNVRARTNLARVLLEQRRPADAVTHLQAALAVDAGVHEVWRVLGNAHAQLGNVDDAIEAYREAIVLNGDDAWSMNNYGLLLIQLSHFYEAVPPLARAVELTPGSALFQNNLGSALERVGELTAAAQAFEAALAADASHARARANLARVSARIEAGMPARARADLSGYARSFDEQVQRWRAGLDDEEEGCLH
jgi:Flp pilus assembly protein TadD